MAAEEHPKTDREIEETGVYIEIISMINQLYIVLIQITNLTRTINVNYYILLVKSRVMILIIKNIENIWYNYKK